ncbi:L10-interacting MYB domain-containing protein [Camellia lanceoleosa]|uniref:L10-interacting MYB domain-containing protein n=1 Tax=Camellia lanceoleosa TaxID=1840588 RepID=A0ACC0HEI1_9ERIC|nr:L10-interacting MYB domain-containing protein [Camellia lanceoleosa]
MASIRSGFRTPSRKGKGPKPHHKANWDWENTRIYLELVVKEIDAGNRPHMSINPNGYRSLAKTYEVATGLTHTIKQLKNRYNQLKAEWRAWSKLIDSRKGPTGIGFDQETGLINALDEWWARMKNVDKECCKFRTKRLDHEELMRRVFTEAAATGKNVWTSGEMRNQLEVEGESNSADFSTDSNELGASETANLMKSATINASGMESDEDTDARMKEMCDDVVALAIEWQTEMNNNYVEANCEDDAIVVAVRNAAEYTYNNIPDRVNLAALDEAIMPMDEDIEMAEVHHRIRAELYQIRRNGR